MSNSKKYILLINIKIPQPEHANIITKLNQISDNTAKPVYFDKNGGAILFKTDLNAKEIYNAITGSVLNDDRFIILEICEQFFTFGHDIAAGWLNRNA